VGVWRSMDEKGEGDVSKVGICLDAERLGDTKNVFGVCEVWCAHKWRD
jgi:hypothetical protein